MAKAGVDALWVIGPSARLVAREARSHGMPIDRVRYHLSLEEALEDPAFEPQEGDTWVFKASRGMHLELLHAEVLERARQLDPSLASKPRQ